MPVGAKGSKFASSKFVKEVTSEWMPFITVFLTTIFVYLTYISEVDLVTFLPIFTKAILRVLTDYKHFIIF